MSDQKQERDITVGEGFDALEWAERCARVTFAKVRNAGYEKEARVDRGSVCVAEARTIAHRHRAVADELRSLRETVAKLPVDATGKPVVPNDTVFAKMGGGKFKGDFYESRGIEFDKEHGWLALFRDRDGALFYARVEECHLDRALAEAALAGEGER